MEKCISDKIAILMATYNSSQFIREQLDSLYSHLIWIGNYIFMMMDLMIIH